MARKREERDSGRKQKRRLQKPDKRYGEDTKEVDVETLKSQLALLGLTLREVPGDGNCLFRALGDQLEGHMGNHYRLRQDTTSYMLEHKEDFQPFVEDDVPFEKHVSELNQLGTYAGNDAIVAFARLHQVTVVIHQPSAPVWQIKGWEVAPESSTSEVKKSKHVNTGSQHARQLHIAYHGGDHYDSVRKFNDTSHLPANIILNVDNNVKKETCERSPTQRFIPGEAEEANEQELEAMERSGCENLFLVRELLYNNCGNLEAAVEDLIAINQMSFTESKTVAKFDDLKQSHANGKARGNLNKKQLEKIRKHERKRASENRKKSNFTEDIPDETVIVGKVQCLNI